MFRALGSVALLISPCPPWQTGGFREGVGASRTHAAAWRTAPRTEPKARRSPEQAHTAPDESDAYRQEEGVVVVVVLVTMQAALTPAPDLPLPYMRLTPTYQ